MLAWDVLAAAARAKRTAMLPRGQTFSEVLRARLLERVASLTCVLLLLAAPLGCEGGDGDHYCSKNGEGAVLTVLLGGPYVDASVTSTGACTQVEVVEREPRGTVWRGRMLRAGEPCTVTVDAKPAPIQRTVQSGEACGAPEGQEVRIGLD